MQGRPILVWDVGRECRRKDRYPDRAWFPYSLVSAACQAFFDLGGGDDDTITGEWYSHDGKQSWYRDVGRVLPDGSIEQSQSGDPIRSDIKTAVLTRKP